MDRWNVLCLGLYMHTWCAVIITSLDHFLILTIHGTLLILYRQQDYRYSDKYKGHYCYKLFCSWQMCHLKNYSSGTHFWIVSSMPNWQECTILKACRLCFHVFIPFEDNLAFSDTIRFGDDCATYRSAHHLHIQFSFEVVSETLWIHVPLSLWNGKIRLGQT